MGTACQRETLQPHKEYQRQSGRRDIPHSMHFKEQAKTQSEEDEEGTYRFRENQVESLRWPVSERLELGSRLWVLKFGIDVDPLGRLEGLQKATQSSQAPPVPIAEGRWLKAFRDADPKNKDRKPRNLEHVCLLDPA